MPSFPEINPVTGAIVDSQLRYTFADRFRIARVSGGKPFDPGLNTRPGPDVAQAVEPPSEDIGLANFDHGATVAMRLHDVNCAAKALQGVRHPNQADSQRLAPPILRPHAVSASGKRLENDGINFS